MECPFRFITKHLRIDHSLFFCFREPCDPVPSFILFIVSTQVNTLLKTHSNSIFMENVFFTALYEQANYTLSTIKTTNEVNFLYADHAT